MRPPLVIRRLLALAGAAALLAVAAYQGLREESRPPAPEPPDVAGSPGALPPLAPASPERALEVVVRQRRRDPESNPVAVLLSDCHPEPLTRTVDSILDEPPYRECVRAARHYRRALELEPGRAASLYGLGMCELQMGRTERAVELLAAREEKLRSQGKDPRAKKKRGGRGK